MVYFCYNLKVVLRYDMLFCYLYLTLSINMIEKYCIIYKNVVILHSKVNRMIVLPRYLFTLKY